MAWFGNKDEEKKSGVAAPAASKTSASVDVSGERSTANILRRPRISEKAFGLSQQNVYTFEVAPDANKYQVANAIKELYKVTPRKVCITRRQPHQERSLQRNRATHKPGLKKAYVYLNAGDTINFM